MSPLLFRISPSFFQRRSSTVTDVPFPPQPVPETSSWPFHPPPFVPFLCTGRKNLLPERRKAPECPTGLSPSSTPLLRSPASRLPYRPLRVPPKAPHPEIVDQPSDRLSPGITGIGIPGVLPRQPLGLYRGLVHQDLPAFGPLPHKIFEIHLPAARPAPSALRACPPVKNRPFQPPESPGPQNHSRLVSPLPYCILL